MTVPLSCFQQARQNVFSVLNKLDLTVFIFPCLNFTLIYGCFLKKPGRLFMNWDIAHWFLLIVKSSHRSCSMKKGVPKNFAKFTGKHLCQSLYFNKVAGLSLNFAKFLRTTFYRITPVAVFAWQHDFHENENAFQVKICYEIARVKEARPLKLKWRLKKLPYCVKSTWKDKGKTFTEILKMSES